MHQSWNYKMCPFLNVPQVCHVCWCVLRHVFCKNNKHCFALQVCFLLFGVVCLFGVFFWEIQSMGKSRCQCYVPIFIWVAKADRAGAKPDPGHSRIPAPYFPFHKLLLSCWSCQLHRKTSPLWGALDHKFPPCVKSFGMGLDPWGNPICNWILLQNPFCRKTFCGGTLLFFGC